MNEMMKTEKSSLTGKLDNRRSWEKQQAWNLDNGATITVEFSQHYGEMITRIDMPDGSIWHCSNGDKDLPEFARPWVEEIHNQHGVIARLVRPSFNQHP